MFKIISLFIIIVILIIIIFLYSKNTNKIVEGYYDLVPYEYHWKIFQCYDYPCVLKTSYDCYKYCNKIEEEGGQENCRQRCLDYADMQIEQLKLPNRDFNYLLPTFKNWSLSEKTSDYFLL
jgi:hypothetical protein